MPPRASKRKANPTKSAPAKSPKVDSVRSASSKGKAASKVAESIDNLFNTYANKSLGSIDPDGVEALCSDLGVDHTDVRVLMLAWKMKAKRQGYFSQDEWQLGLKALQADTITKLKKALPKLEAEAAYVFLVDGFSKLHDGAKVLVNHRATENMKLFFRKKVAACFAMREFSVSSASIPTLSPAPAPEPLPSGGIKGAYWPSWLAGTVTPAAIPTEYFTHVFYAFAVPDPTSFQLLISPADGQLMQDFTSSLHSQNPPARAFLSIAGAATLYVLTNSKDTRASFIKSSIDVARKFEFDGLDLDWEFPNTTEAMANLSLLFQEWRLAIDQDSFSSGKPRLQLSAAVYFAPTLLFPASLSYPSYAMRTYLDFLNPMCYDYRGAWNTSVTGAQALLYDRTSNISTSYGIWSWKQTGVDSRKIVMGMPLYGRTWELKDPKKHGIGDAAVGVGPGNNGDGILSYSDIVGFNLGNNATVVYDNATVSTYSYAGTNWIGYDDVTSITTKIRFAKAQGLGGYFFWALGYDNHWTLSKAASMAWDETN
nr:chitotriosidase-1-like [Ipomoea trifida]